MSGSEHDAVKAVISDLIATATSYDVTALDRIYHDDLNVTIVAPDGQISHADKEGFKALFEGKKRAGDPPMNTWARFHHIAANNDSAVVVLSRKNDLGGVEMDLNLTIDLIHEDDRWQVRREVIFLHPTA